MIPPSLADLRRVLGPRPISSVASTRPRSSSAPTRGTSRQPRQRPSSSTAARDQGKENDVVNQAEFMKLLVAQLQNQDPLNPLDSANFSAQLAQFSSLEQLTQINQKLSRSGATRHDRPLRGGRLHRPRGDGREPGHRREGRRRDDARLHAHASAARCRRRSSTAAASRSRTSALGSQGAGAHTFDLSKVSGRAAARRRARTRSC